MPDIASLSVRVDADTSAAESGLARLNQQVSGAGSAIAAAFGTAAVAGVVALGAGLVGSIKSAADFEKQMSAVGAVAGASAGEMQQLTSAALQLGKDTSFSASEAAKSIEELVKAGVSIEDVLGGGARAALDLAAAGAISVGDAAEIASNALNVFGLKGADMAHVADVIAGAANASAIGVNDYKFSLSAAGAVAATVGISFESLSQAIAVMGNAGIKGSDAGTSLKTMMMNLIPTTAKQNDLFRDLGIVTFDVQRGLEGAAKKGIVPATQDLAGLTGAMMDQLGIGRDVAKWTKDDRAEYEKLSTALGLTKNEFFTATGEAKNFGEIAEVLKTALKGMTKEQQLATLETMFGSDAIRAAAVLLEAGAEGFDKMAEAMGKVTAQQVAEERLNNLWGSVEKLKGSLETGAIILGGMFTPKLKEMADMLTGAVNQGIDALEQLPDVIETVKQVLAGEWATDDSIRPFTKAIGEAAVVFRDDFLPTIMMVSDFVTGTLAPAFMTVANFLTEHSEIIAGAAAAWAAFTIISTVAGWITGAIAAWGAMSGAITAAGGVIAAIIAVLGGPLTVAILAIAAVVGLLTAAWIGNWGDIQGKTQAVIDWMTPYIQAALAAITGFWTTHGDAIIATATAAWEMVKTAVTTSLQVIGLLITAAVALWNADWSAAWTAIVEATTIVLAALAALFAPVWEAINATVQAALDVMGEAINTAWTTFTGYVQEGWDAILKIATAAWNLLSAENQTKITEMVRLITELWALLPKLWTAGTAAISTTTTAWWTTLTGYWTTGTTTITTTQTTFWTAAVTLWTTQTAGITALITKWWPAIHVIWLAALKVIQDAMATAWAAIVAATTKFFEDLGKQWEDAKTTLGNAATALGTAVVEFLAKAINDKIGSVVDAVIGGVKRALDGARGLLGSFGSSGAGSSNPAEYLKQAALARGIDPEQVAKVMMKEGGGSWDATGNFSTGTSVGPLQLHYAGGSNPARGMGDDFTRDTGIDLRTDKSAEAGRKAIDYALDRLAETGDYREYYGADSALGSRFTAVNRVTPSIKQANIAQIGQSQMGLDPGDAAAACGPAALAWFMNQMGRTPTGAEALKLAQAGGWDAQRGMYGPGAFGSALSSAGISNVVDTTPTAGEVGSLAASGNPFVISTGGTTDELGNSRPGHYFQVQGGTTDALNVGASGTALRGGSAVMSLAQIVALSGAMNGIITLSGQMGESFTVAGAQTSTAITTMAQTGVAQAGVLSTGVSAQYDLMANKVQGTVTNLGAGTMTSLKDVAGTSVVTVTDMSGAITSQYATMASGVNVTMGALGTTVSSTTDVFTGHITTTMTDAMGNVVTTVTSQTGAVISQFGTMATGVIASQTDLSTQVVGITTATGEAVVAQNTTTNEALVANNNQMHTQKISDDTNAAGITVARYTETSGALVTIVTDQNGQILADFTTSAQDIGKVTTDSNTRRLSETTNALGQTVTVYREASGEIVTLVTDAAGKTVSQFSNVGTSAKTMGDTVRTAGKAFGEFPEVDLSDHVRELSAATKAALAYQKALVAAAKASDDLAGKPGGKKSSKELAKRAGGGWTSANQMTLVGELGPELISTSRPMYVTPNDRLMPPAMSMGGGGGVTERIVFVIRDPDGRTLEEWAVRGQRLAVERGRG